MQPRHANSPAQTAHVVQQKQHLGLRQAPPQALPRAKAKGQGGDPGARAPVVQPALGMITLRPSEHGGVSTQAVELHLDECLQKGWGGVGEKAGSAAPREK